MTRRLQTTRFGLLPGASIWDSAKIDILIPFTFTAVQLERIRKSFDGKDVISDLNLTINDGEFLTLLGPSGCGKTTVLRLIAGLESVDSGHIHLKSRTLPRSPLKIVTLTPSFKAMLCSRT